jgi:hypothetical protein
MPTKLPLISVLYSKSEPCIAWCSWLVPLHPFPPCFRYILVFPVLYVLTSFISPLLHPTLQFLRRSLLASSLSSDQTDVIRACGLSADCLSGLLLVKIESGGFIFVCVAKSCLVAVLVGWNGEGSKVWGNLLFLCRNMLCSPCSWFVSLHLRCK